MVASSPGTGSSVECAEDREGAGHGLGLFLFGCVIPTSLSQTIMLFSVLLSQESRVAHVPAVTNTFIAPGDFPVNTSSLWTILILKHMITGTFGGVDYGIHSTGSSFVFVIKGYPSFRFKYCSCVRRIRQKKKQGISPVFHLLFVVIHRHPVHHPDLSTYRRRSVHYSSSPVPLRMPPGIHTFHPVHDQ